MCKLKGMRVMQLESKEESNSVAKFLKDSGLSSTPFFTALENSAQNNSKNTEGCHSLFNSQVRSESCTQEANFMCEISRELFKLLPFDKGASFVFQQI